LRSLIDGQHDFKMQPQQNFNSGAGAGADSGSIACSQCGAPMPRDMRFCRACGNRLGEGPAEYTETVRLPHAQATGAQYSNYTPAFTAPIQRPTGSEFPAKRKRRMSGMTWVFIVIAFFFLFGGVMSLIKRPFRNPPRAIVNIPGRTFFGVNELENVTGGVSFDVVAPAGSPADKAGLVGGDIITSFDGRAVTDDDEFRDLLRQTPVGKTVEVIYLRDGETRKTQLTTISESEFSGLQAAARNQPRGKFGYEEERVTKIANAATKTYGMRLDYLEENGPARLFGLKVGDIITEFDGIPIRTREELLSRVRRAQPLIPVEITVVRDGQTLKIPVTMGRG
jgi:membrane-associated protease RseP (regulator of RpoE activity)